MINISYVDYVPDITYIYNCEICKKEVTTAYIKTCLVCNRKLCRNCYRDNLCTDHYSMLSSEGKEEFNRLVKNYKNKKYIVVLLGVLSFITWIVLFFSILITVSLGYNGEWITLFITIFMILFFLIIIIFKINVKKMNKKILKEKIDLFEKHKVSEIIVIDSTHLTTNEKICQSCGRNLRLDAIYCDYCGKKVGERRSKP